MALSSKDTRIRINGEFSAQMRSVLTDHNMSYEEELRRDGNVSFVIGAVDTAKLAALLDTIPKEYFALKATIRS